MVIFLFPGPALPSEASGNPQKTLEDRTQDLVSQCCCFSLIRKSLLYQLLDVQKYVLLTKTVLLFYYLFGLKACSVTRCVGIQVPQHGHQVANYEYQDQQDLARTLTTEISMRSCTNQGFSKCSRSNIVSIEKRKNPCECFKNPCRESRVPEKT